MATAKKFSFVLAIFSALLGGVLASDASANTIYVSTTGSDSNPGTASAPVANVRKAYDLAASGDVIYLRGGRYTLTSTVWVEKNNLTIASHPGESAALVGSTSDTTNLQNMIAIMADNVSLVGLEIQGGSFYAVKIESNNGTLIRNCRLHGSGRDCVKMFNADNTTIENCDIGPSGVRDPSNAEAIDSVGSRATVVRGCYVHDTATNGIYVKGGASGCVIEGNRVERTGHAGILLGQDTDLEFMRDGTRFEALDSVAKNNVVVAAGGAGIGTYSGSNVRFENNTLYDVARNFHGGFYIASNSREVPSQRVLFKNNVVVVLSDRPMVFVLNLSDQFASDSNIWFRPNGGTYRFWRESPTRGDFWTSLSAWQTGMNCDARSVTADPLLDSTRLFKPMSGSPAIDRGEALSEVTFDFSGATRPQGSGYDIGAHEMFVSSGNRPPQVQISTSVLSGAPPLPVTFTANATDPDGQIVAYRWDFGDGQSSSQVGPTHVYGAPGSFDARVVVTDNLGATATASIVINVTPSSPPASVGNVVWANIVGCAVSGNTLTKTATTVWGNAGAVSAQTLTAGDGLVEFTALETDKERVCGFSTFDIDQNLTTIPFCIHLNTGGAFYVIESGVSRGYFGDYAPGDVFRVAVEGGRVKYYRNGILFYTSSATPVYPLMVDTALQAFGATLVNVVVSFGSGGGGTPLAPVVRVVRPDKGEALMIGTEYLITWSATGEDIQRQDVEFSPDGGATWTTVASGLPGTATGFTWRVPKPKTKNGRIRVTAHASSGLKGVGASGSFSIVKQRRASN